MKRLIGLALFILVCFSFSRSQDLAPIKTVEASELLPRSNKGIFLQYQEVPDRAFCIQLLHILRQYKAVCDSSAKKPEFSDFLQWFEKKNAATPYSLVKLNGKEIKVYRAE